MNAVPRTCLIRPCPYCGGENLTVYIDRHQSYIRCECGMETRYFCAGCSDATAGDIMDALTAVWNTRAEDRKEEVKE